MQKFEVIANDTSYGFYHAENKEGALIAHVIDAGYASIEAAAETIGETEEEFRSAFRIEEEEVKISGIYLSIWEGNVPAIYFTVSVGEEKTKTLEWLTTDGTLVQEDSHLTTCHDFNDHVRKIIDETLENYLKKNPKKVDSLLSQLEEEASEDDEEYDY